MKKLNLVLLSVEDWEGLYVNGELEDEGHSIELQSYLKKLVGQQIEIEIEDHYIELGPDNPDLDNYGNRFPQKLEDFIEYTKLKEQ